MCQLPADPPKSPILILILCLSSPAPGLALGWSGPSSMVSSSLFTLVCAIAAVRCTRTALYTTRHNTVRLYLEPKAMPLYRYPTVHYEDRSCIFIAAYYSVLVRTLCCVLKSTAPRLNLPKSPWPCSQAEVLRVAVTNAGGNRDDERRDTGDEHQYGLLIAAQPCRRNRGWWWRRRRRSRRRMWQRRRRCRQWRR